MYYGSYVFLGTTVQEISLKFNDLWGVIQKKKKKCSFFTRIIHPFCTFGLGRNQKKSEDFWFSNIIRGIDRDQWHEMG